MLFWYVFETLHFMTFKTTKKHMLWPNLGVLALFDHFWRRPKHDFFIFLPKYCILLVSKSRLSRVHNSSENWSDQKTFFAKVSEHFAHVHLNIKHFSYSKNWRFGKGSIWPPCRPLSRICACRLIGLRIWRITNPFKRLSLIQVLILMEI